VIEFFWHRRDEGGGVRWALWSKFSATFVGQCTYSRADKRWRCTAAVKSKDNPTKSCEYVAGTAAAARRALEADWSKRSIGLFGEDDIRFIEMKD
jgi:hypothetical protein